MLNLSNYHVLYHNDCRIQLILFGNKRQRQNVIDAIIIDHKMRFS